MSDRDVHFYPIDSKRPELITAICLLGFLYLIVSLIAWIFLQDIHFELIHWYGHDLRIITIIVDAITLIAFIGIWRMKLWGIVLYAALYLIASFYSISKGLEYLWGYIPGFIVMLSCLVYAKRFS